MPNSLTERKLFYSILLAGKLCRKRWAVFTAFIPDSQHFLLVKMTSMETQSQLPSTGMVGLLP